jgi:sensor domain CHASE-containing protein
MDVMQLTISEIEALINKKIKQVHKLTKVIRTHGAEMCRARLKESGWVCDRKKGHSGLHVAVTSDRVLVIWNEGDIE